MNEFLPCPLCDAPCPFKTRPTSSELIAGQAWFCECGIPVDITTGNVCIQHSKYFLVGNAYRTKIYLEGKSSQLKTVKISVKDILSSTQQTLDFFWKNDCWSKFHKLNIFL